MPRRIVMVVVLAILFLGLLLPGCRVDPPDPPDLPPPEPDPLWDDLGLPAFAFVDTPAVALDPDGLPIVVLTHFQPLIGHRARVLRRTAGGGWLEIGDFEARTFEAPRRPALAVDGAGRPVVAFTAVDERMSVWRWSDPAWEDLGAASTGAARQPSICFDDENSPIIAFVDEEAGDIVRAARWAGGTSWTDLGVVSPGAAGYPSIGMASRGAPLVAYTDEANGTRVRAAAWDAGTTWIDLGYLDPQSASEPSLAIDASGAPVVLFVEQPFTAILHVVRWDGSAWSEVFPSGSRYRGSSGGDRNLSAAPDGNLYLVTTVDGSSQCLRGSLSGVWESLGVVGSGTVTRTTITVGDDGRPVVAFVEDMDIVLKVHKHR